MDLKLFFCSLEYNLGSCMISFPIELCHEKTAKTKAHISCASCDRAADQRICFPFIDRRIPLLPKSEISNL